MGISKLSGPCVEGEISYFKMYQLGLDHTEVGPLHFHATLEVHSTFTALNETEEDPQRKEIRVGRIITPPNWSCLARLARLDIL